VVHKNPVKEWNFGSKWRKLGALFLHGFTEVAG
jgi:hypothetical protein